MIDSIAMLRPGVVQLPHGGGGDAPAHLGLILGFGIPVFVAGILLVVFTLVRRSIRRQVEGARRQAEGEGIVLDSGPIWMTIRYNGFRSSNLMIGAGIRKTRATLLLTRERLTFVPGSRHYFTVNKADFPRFNVVTEDGAVRMHTDNPPAASGSLDYRFAVSDPAAWASALADAGARKA
jgi:hypothetical protein